MYFFETGAVKDVDLNEFVIVRTELGEDAGRAHPSDGSPLVMMTRPLGPSFKGERRRSLRDEQAQAHGGGRDQGRGRDGPRAQSPGQDPGGGLANSDGRASSSFYRALNVPTSASSTPALAAHFVRASEFRRMGARD